MHWQAILALDELALNLAIEEQCYGRLWQHWDDGSWSQCNGVPQGHAVPQHPASWDRTMALAWRYGIDITPPSEHLPGKPGWVLSPWRRTHAMPVATEAEARGAVCRVALWRATHPKEGATP